MIDDISKLVDSVIDEFKYFDLDFNKTRQEYSETPKYLKKHRHEYIRTIRDIVDYSKNHKITKILEIGAFFGLVSICLSKLGFQVCAADIPEYMSMPEQQKRFSHYDIEIAQVRLEDYILPFLDESFDVIIMCEVLEHLNFNPLPLLKEINRIGTPNSLFYLSLPNLAQLHKRIKFLLGRSILQPVQGYFDQLDPNKLMIVNGHWREYTGSEIREMLEKLGYEIQHQYYFSLVETFEKPTLKNRLNQFIYSLNPSFKENQTTLAIRKERTKIVFNIPNTVHKTLERV